jgi:cbb3-type cytochrome oxidase maturation protein
MSSLIYLIPLALLLGGTALAAFMWSLRSGQYDDLDGAAERIFLETDGDRADSGTGELDTSSASGRSTSHERLAR